MRVFGVISISKYLSNQDNDKTAYTKVCSVTALCQKKSKARMMSSKSASLPKSHLDDTEGRSQTLVVFHGSEHSFCSHLLGDLMRTNLTLNLDL